MSFNSRSAPPASAGDTEAIRQLLARYCFLLDRDRDADAIVELFAPDGSWEGLGEGCKQGDALREFMQRATSSPIEFRHLVSDPEIVVEGDRARARSSLLVLKAGQPPEILFAGMFADTLTRIDGQWYFQSRTVVTP